VSGDIKVFSDTTQVVEKGGEVTTITRTRMVFNDLTITGKSVGEDHLGNFALNLFGTPTSPGMAIAAGYYQEGERRE
jgi:hypothetical protein